MAMRTLLLIYLLSKLLTYGGLFNLMMFRLACYYHPEKFKLSFPGRPFTKIQLWHLLQAKIHFYFSHVLEAGLILQQNQTCPPVREKLSDERCINSCKNWKTRQATRLASWKAALDSTREPSTLGKNLEFPKLSVIEPVSSLVLGTERKFMSGVTRARGKNQYFFNGR